MVCNFCGKTLDTCDEANLGELTVRFFYGSKRDGDRMKFSMCSDCVDKLTDEFIARCKHAPTIEAGGIPNNGTPVWKSKAIEEMNH